LPRQCTARPKGLRTVVIEREAPGGQAGTSSRIEETISDSPERAFRATKLASRGAAPGRARPARGRRLSGDSFHYSHRSGRPGRSSSTVTRSLRATDRHFWRPASRGVGSRIDGLRSAHRQGASIMVASRSEAGATHGLDIHLIGSGKLGRSGRFALRQPRPARLTLVVRGRCSGEEHVALSDRAAARENRMWRSSCARKSRRSTARHTWTAIDIREGGRQGGVSPA